MALPLFERLGGFARVRCIVSAFYDRVLECEELQPYFARADTRRLIDHQTKFIASLMGGPAAFSDEVLRRVHAPLGIARSDFELMAELLRETLEDADLSAIDIAHVMAQFQRREPVIVSREA